MLIRWYCNDKPSPEPEDSEETPIHFPIHFPIHCTPSPTLRKLPCFGLPGLCFTFGFVQQQPPLSQFLLHSPSAKKLHKKTRPGQDQKVPEILPPSLIHGGCQESFANGINLNMVDENHLNESSQDKQESWSFPPPWGALASPVSASMHRPFHPEEDMFLAGSLSRSC